MATVVGITGFIGYKATRPGTALGTKLSVVQPAYEVTACHATIKLAGGGEADLFLPRQEGYAASTVNAALFVRRPGWRVRKTMTAVLTISGIDITINSVGSPAVVSDFVEFQINAQTTARIKEAVQSDRPLMLKFPNPKVAPIAIGGDPTALAAMQTAEDCAGVVPYAVEQPYTAEDGPTAKEKAALEVAAKTATNTASNLPIPDRYNKSVLKNPAEVTPECAADLRKCPSSWNKQ